jgi:hypothetical protein
MATSEKVWRVIRSMCRSAGSVSRLLPHDCAAATHPLRLPAAAMNQSLTPGTCCMTADTARPTVPESPAWCLLQARDLPWVALLLCRLPSALPVALPPSAPASGLGHRSLLLGSAAP